MRCSPLDQSSTPSLTYRRRTFPWRRLLPAASLALAAAGHEIHLTQPGSISNLTIRPQQMLLQAPTFNEATIDVQAAGLNFRDVLNVLGLDPTGMHRPIGGEAAGIVSTVGPTFGHVLPSQRAYGLAPGSLRTRAQCDARYIRCMTRTLEITRVSGSRCGLCRFSCTCTVVHRQRRLPLMKRSRFLWCGPRHTTALFRRSFGPCRMCLSMVCAPTC